MFERLHKYATETNIAFSAKIVILVLAVIAFFSQDLAIVFTDALQTEATSYILIIPFLLLYLLYRKRKMLRASIASNSGNSEKETRYLPLISGIVTCALAMLLYWYGSNTFTPLEYHVFALPIFTAGLVLILFNPYTLRQLAFPVAFLIFLVPIPAQILYTFGSMLSVLSSEASNAIINALGIHSSISSNYGNPTIILIRPGQEAMNFTVDIACSGIYSLISFVVMAAFIAYIVRDKTWKKISILLIGLPLIYLFNVARVTLILLIGYQFGETMALDVFHLIGGWILLFIGTLLLLTIAEKGFKTKLFSKSSNIVVCEDCKTKSVSQKENFCFHCGRLLKYPQIKLQREDIIRILAIVIAVTLLFSIQSPVFALTESPAQIIIQTPEGEKGNTLILPQISGYNLTFLYRDKEFEQVAQQDLSLSYAYWPADRTKETIYVSIEAATTIYSLHRWEACLVTWPESLGYQAKVSQLELKDVQILDNPLVVARYFGFQNEKTNLTQLVLYWYETSTTVITNNTAQQDIVKISLITYPKDAQSIPEHESILLPFAVSIANYWQPMKTWTAASFFLAKNSLLFVGATLVLLVFFIVFSIVKKMNLSEVRAKAYLKLSKLNQQMIDSVTKTEERGLPTLSSIASHYQETTGQKITEQELLQMLSGAEKLGFIETSVANDKDEPIQIWKSPTIFNNLERKLKTLFSRKGSVE